MLNEATGDITKVHADVIVNAANTELRHGGGVALAIARAAGEQLEAESEEAAPVAFGDIAITSAGDLPAKEVIHIPTVDYWSGGKCASLKDIEQSWRKALDYCVKVGHTSVAVPLLGTGVAGLDKTAVRNLLASVAEQYPSLTITVVKYN